MTYYLVRYHYKHKVDGVFSVIDQSLDETYDRIEALQKQDVERGDADDWQYSVVAVEPTAEYPAPERSVLA